MLYKVNVHTGAIVTLEIEADSIQAALRTAAKQVCDEEYSASELTVTGNVTNFGLAELNAQRPLEWKTFDRNGKEVQEVP